MKLSIYTSVLVAGLCTTSWVLQEPVQAAETIILKYDSQELALPLAELQQGGLARQLPALLPQMKGNDRVILQGAQALLFQKVKVPAVIDQFLDSSTGQFALQLLDGIILSQKSDLQSNLTHLKTAIERSASDNQISFMELLEAYPQKQVKVNLGQLTTTVSDVSSFVQRSRPVLSMARNILADIACDCESISTQPGDKSVTLAHCQSVAQQSNDELDTRVSSLESR